jgi:hypothetical protein
MGARFERQAPNGKDMATNTTENMVNPVTVLAPIKLATGKTEADLLAASDRFQKEFADAQPGIIRRELVRTGDGEYLDIVQFRNVEDAKAIIEKEKESAVCHAFFSVMNMGAAEADGSVEFYPSLATYNKP